MPAPVEPVALGNIFDLSRPVRLSLLRGDVWTVMIGDQAVARMPKNLLMTVSSMAQDAYKSDNKTTVLQLPQDSVSKEAVKVLMEWLAKTCHPITAYRFKLFKVAAKDLAVFRAGEILGMNTCVEHIMQSYKAYIKAAMPTYDDLIAIENFARSPTDELFALTARRIAHLRYNKQIADAAVFEQYFSQHPELANAMKGIDKKYSADRVKREAHQAMLAEKRAKYEEGVKEREEAAKERAAVAAEKQKSRDARLKKDLEMKESIRRKQGGRKGALTAEELRFVARRG